MKKLLLSAVVGFVAGAIVLGATMFSLMPGMMLIENESRYGLEETVQKLLPLIEANHWAVKQQYALHKGAAKLGVNIKPVIVIELGSAPHSSRILAIDENRRTAVMMPARIAVYEKEAGGVYIAMLDLDLMGRMFGGVVRDVMVVAQEEHDAIVKGIVK